MIKIFMLISFVGSVFYFGIKIIDKHQADFILYRSNEIFKNQNRP